MEENLARQLLDELYVALHDAGDVEPLLRKAARLAHVADEPEYGVLFEVHLDGIPTKVVEATDTTFRITKWKDQQRKPQWDPVAACFEDRKTSDGQMNAGTASQFDFSLHEVERLYGEIKPGPSKMKVIPHLNDLKAIRARIINRIGIFASAVERRLEGHDPPIAPWNLVHPAIAAVAKTRFESGHFADAVEAALKAVNVRVKNAFIAAGKPEQDGTALMYAALGGNAPVIRLDDLRSESGRNIQEGYTHIFAGAMLGIRNPKAHDNIQISERRGLHLVILASLLMEKLDEAGVRP